MAWKKHLEKEHACVLFKSNTQGQSSRLGSNKLYQNSLFKNPELAHNIIATSKAVGTDKLMELIKNYSKIDGIKRAVTVGVIGFPNAGKSSLINSLKKQKSVGVSGTAGFTKNLQVIELESKVKIIDSPGIIMGNEDETTLVLRNQINAEEVKEPIGAVGEILKRISKDLLLRLYKIADFSNPTQFLFNIAQARGKYRKGGVVDIEAAARVVIEDWNSGKMKHYLTPPDFDPSLMIDYDEFVGMDVNNMSDFVKKQGDGQTLTEVDFDGQQPSGMQLE